MKRTLSFIIFIVSCTYLLAVNTVEHQHNQNVKSLSLETLSKQQNIHDIQNTLGRKLTFREKVAFKVINMVNIIDNQENPKNKKKNLAIAALVLGIVSILPYIGIITSIVGLVLAAKSLKIYKQSIDKDGKGMAVAGLVLCIIFLSLNILSFLSVAILFLLIF